MHLKNGFYPEILSSNTIPINIDKALPLSLFRELGTYENWFLTQEENNKKDDHGQKPLVPEPRNTVPNVQLEYSLPSATYNNHTIRIITNW